MRPYPDDQSMSEAPIFAPVPDGKRPLTRPLLASCPRCQGPLTDTVTEMGVRQVCNAEGHHPFGRFVSFEPRA